MSTEIVLACSPGHAGIIIAWDLCTGTELMHFRGYASIRNSLTTIGPLLIAASQIHKPSPNCVSSAAPICFWTWGSPQIYCRIFPCEQIGPLACTSDGTYLFGGGISGQIYIWETSTRQLVRSWHAHKKCVSCSILSDDESLLVSGSDDGFVIVWPLIRILDMVDSEGMQMPSFLYSWDAHSLPVTDLATGVGGCNAILLSCSLDCTVKIWSLGLGTHLRTLGMPCAINCVVVDPSEHALYAGGTDGRIYVGLLKEYSRRNNGIGVEDGIIGSLFDHNGPITNLGFSMDGVTLVSASEDCTIRMWDTCSNCVLRVINHDRGPVSSIIVLPMPPQLSRPSHYEVQMPSYDDYVQTMDGIFNDCNYAKDISRLFLSRIEKAGFGVGLQYCSAGIMERRIKELEAMKANLAIVNEDRRRALDMLDKMIEVYHKLSGLCASESVAGEEKKDTEEEGGKDNILFLHKSIEEDRRLLQ